MQVYKPIVDPHDPRYGLNPYRYYVNTVIFILPIVLASLAFINPDGGYAGGGSVCWLPIRPIWYRLGLSWIPRYIVFVVVTYLCVAVYIHVGRQFRQFRKASTTHLKAFGGENPNSPPSSTAEESRPRQVSFSDEPPQITTILSDRRSNTGKRSSAPGMPILSEATAHPASILYRQPNYRRHTTDVGSLCKHRTLLSLLKETRHNIPGTEDLVSSTIGVQSNSPARQESVVTNTTLSSDWSRKSCQTMPVLPSMATLSLDQWMPPVGQTATDPERGMTVSSAEEMIEARRQTMIKQMRMNFVYPIVYITLWFIPFVLHCMQFTNKYAHNAPPVLASLSTLCIASMGLANSLAFLFREKPWEEIGWPDWVVKMQEKRRANSENLLVRSGPTTLSTQQHTEVSSARHSSGSSSFLLRMMPQEEQSKVGQDIQGRKQLSSFKPWSAKQKARERLNLEQQDRQKSLERKQQLSESTDPPTQSNSRVTATDRQ
jgi:G protein-coupled receptor GPR1